MFALQQLRKREVSLDVVLGTLEIVDGLIDDLNVLRFQREKLGPVFIVLCEILQEITEKTASSVRDMAQNRLIILFEQFEALVRAGLYAEYAVKMSEYGLKSENERVQNSAKTILKTLEILKQRKAELTLKRK